MRPSRVLRRSETYHTVMIQPQERCTRRVHCKKKHRHVTADHDSVVGDTIQPCSKRSIDPPPGANCRSCHQSETEEVPTWCPIRLSAAIGPVGFQLAQFLRRSRLRLRILPPPLSRHRVHRARERPHKRNATEKANVGRTKDEDDIIPAAVPHLLFPRARRRRQRMPDVTRQTNHQERGERKRQHAWETSLS